MIEAIRKFFSSPTDELDPEIRQDVRTTHRAAVALLVIGLASIPMVFLLESPLREFTLLVTILGVLIWLLTIQLVKNARLTAAKLIILGVNTFNLYSVIYVTGGFAQPTVFTLIFLLALAYLLFPKQGALMYGSILLLLATLLVVFAELKWMPVSPSFAEIQPAFLTFMFVLFTVTTMLTISSVNSRANIEDIRRNEEDLRKQNAELDQLRLSLENRVDERTAQIELRTAQLEAVSSVARSVASLQDIEALLPTITRLVSSRFDFYHAGIFLVDDNREYAVLRAANSEGGQRMLGRNHKLKLDTSSIVGYVTSRGEARIALDVGSDAVFFDNPDLPDTRSEMALPLRLGGATIGALDVQSVEPNAFKRDDIKTLSILADQISVAIENSRLFGETNKALQEAERAFETYIKQEWLTFTSQVDHTGYQYDGKQVLPIDSNKPRHSTEPLPQTGTLGLSKKAGKITLPLRFRGQTIGVIDVQPKAQDRLWTQDDITLLEAAAERAVLALENARLVESSQRRASREQVIGEISSRIGQSSDLNIIMQTAVEELGRRIGGVAEVTFEIEKPTDKDRA